MTRLLGVLLVLSAAPSPLGEGASKKARALAESAMGQVGVTTQYDPAYEKLPYPNGDVPAERGVCTDVVVRAFRTLGLDLQKELHVDMSAHFNVYPTRWGLKKPDANIDHRRVQNLATWLTRHGKAVPVTKDGADYWPGDLVTMDVDGRAHIALISTTLAPDGTHFDIVHNIGAGTQVEDRLFEFPITGHYRYY
jgi:uncharacterized protein YijF (DUF1287 family)